MNLTQIETLNKELTNKSSLEILEYFTKNHTDKITFATALNIEDQVVTHMLSKLKDKIKIFTLDTGRLFPETYELLDKTRNRYKQNIDVYFPNSKEVETMVNTKGINLFFESIENRKLCCGVRKLEPLKRALEGYDFWISGLRREQSPTRSDMKLVEWDANNGLVKINPLIEWSEKDCWDYINEHNVPFSNLHKKGFTSIGCQPCTRAIMEGEDIRAGRWWWEDPDTKECGLHKR